MPDDLLDHLSPRFIACSILPWADALLRSTPGPRGAGPGTDSATAGMPAYRALFDTRAEPAQAQSSDAFRVRPKISPYITVAAARSLLGPRFPLERDPGSADSLLRWYLESYGTQPNRQMYRIPLSPSEIQYLNAPVALISGVEGLDVSRVSFSLALGDDEHRSSGRMFVDAEAYWDHVYWWSVERAVELRVEDCLVPDYYVQALMAPGSLGAPHGVPLSRFLQLYVARNDGLHGVDLRSEYEALGVYLHVMLRGAREPHLLRFVPDTIRDAFLERDADGRCALDALTIAAVRAQGRRGDEARQALPSKQPCELFEASVWDAGYDLAAGTYRSIDANGYRIHAAQLPSLAGMEHAVDVQVTGPFGKASGLGQSCRLAGEALQRTSLSTNLVDFGLDNPTPSGFGSRAVTSEPVSARVNLLHLNADAVPLAYAYLPDVFTGSYNIGFFYWELSTPAVPFELALRMLDEVWVASEYGVSVFQPFSDIPVTNVGTPFQAVPDIPRARARALLRERLGIDDETFVFLTTFDSYSWPTRKNPLGALAAFQQAFGEGDDAMLILKTHNARNVGHDSQRSELERLFAAAERDPRVVILDETMQYEDLLRLKKGSDAYVSLHRSEGFGYGPIEAMALGVPVVCTAYSGNMDYCSQDTAWLVSYELIDVSEREYIFVRPGHKWAEPSVADAATQMRRCYEEEALRQRIAGTAREFVTANFSVEAIAKRYEARLQRILGA